MKVGVYFWFGIVCIFSEGVALFFLIRSEGVAILCKLQESPKIVLVGVMQCKWAPNTKLRTFLGTKVIDDKFLGVRRVPHTWYSVSDPSRPNVF